MKRTKRIQLRVTEEEKNIIEEAASIEGLSSADFVRKTLLIQCKQKSKVQLQRKAKNEIAKNVFALNGAVRKLGGSVEAMTKRMFDNPNLTKEDRKLIGDYQNSFKITRTAVETWKQEIQKGA